MTNGRGAGMASFMTKKKKYKFQVDICLEDLLEVPFVSAVLFAKLRLLDGGNFQDHSTRQEVKDHAVKWGSKFSFPCKMMANASTGILERCVLRISVRKECKGGRSFTKLGFVDINLAEYAGAGEISKKALLEGYDARHRQDNSLLKYSMKMHMLSGDILFKVPSPSIKHKQVGNEDNNSEGRTLDELSGNSLAGSIASGSSGFGSLTKKRPQLLSSELVIGQTLNESSVPVTVADDVQNSLGIETEYLQSEQGHSRNSSNTSQMSKASGYSSIHSHSHSRQSSSGDSSHVRDSAQRPKRTSTVCCVPTTHLELTPPVVSPRTVAVATDALGTPRSFGTQLSELSTESNSDDYRTPDDTLDSEWFSACFDLQKSFSCSDAAQLRNCEFARSSTANEPPGKTSNEARENDGVSRSKSEFQIPRNVKRKSFRKFVEKSDSLFSLLTPVAKRKNNLNGAFDHSTPKQIDGARAAPSASPAHRYQGLDQNRTFSLTSLRFGNQGADHRLHRSVSHRKLFEGSQGGKLAPVIISPDEHCATVTSDCLQTPTTRRTSVTTNPSSSSLVLSETGSLDRAKAALEKRKKVGSQLPDPELLMQTTTGRVEETRVNPNRLIEELLKNTNLEPNDDSAETSGLQLFIAKDGTAALGSHEVKTQMSTGQHFKQVVMEDKR